MDENDLDTNISNNLSIEMELDDNDGYWDANDQWRKCVKIKVKLMYNGKEISSDYVKVDV